jgi:hypothetical protein
VSRCWFSAGAGAGAVDITLLLCSPENVRNECDATVRLSHDELVHLPFGADKVVHHSGSLDTLAIALFFIPVITWQAAKPMRCELSSPYASGVNCVCV